jgi:hypothetical protein
MELADGTCLEPGIPPGACAAGFVHDGDRSCEPILPDACAAGLMAVPGDATCREVAPCGDSTWGEIAVAADTQFVDLSYAGMDSDGSAAKPWLTIQAGIDAADDDATVAVAAGTYPENLVILNKTITLAGRCPSMVEVVGSGTDPTLYVVTGAQGTRVRGVSLTGSSFGIGLSGATDVVLQQIRIHDTAGRGLVVQDDFGPTNFRLEDSLIEEVHMVGIYLYDVDAEVVRSVVRSTKPNAGQHGRGINQQRTPAVRPSLTIVGSWIVDNRENGVFSSGGDVTIDASVVHGTVAPLSQVGGVGVVGQFDVASGEQADLRVTGSQISASEGAGVSSLGSLLHVEHTVVRDTVPDLDGARGWGISFQENSGVPSQVEVLSSVLDSNTQVGVHSSGSIGVIDNTLIRGTLPPPPSLAGGGLVLRPSPDDALRSSVQLRWSQVQDNHYLGVYVMGSDSYFESVAVQGTLALADLSAGNGVHLNATAAHGSIATFRKLLIEDSVGFGLIAFNSSVDVDDAIVRRTTGGDGGTFGDGVTIAFSNKPTTAVLRRARIEESTRAAVSNFGATVVLSDTTIHCNTLQLNGETNFGNASTFIDEGGNVCGCDGELGECKQTSSALQPPGELPAAE